MAKDFSQKEKEIRELFCKGAKFCLNGNDYIVKEAGKPLTSKGEPKTDIYVLATNEKEDIEIKISYKKSNADFLENKISDTRAKQIFGENWDNIIKSATAKIKEKFEAKPLVYKKSKGKTEEGAITLGWKFEFLNKISGELSEEVPLTNEQLRDIYAGTQLEEDKRNAKVNGVKIQESGVANYVLFEDDLSSISSIQDVIDEMITIEELIKKGNKIFFACKALNFRTKKNKYDGNRPLAVYVDWSVDGSKLKGVLKYDRPLTCKGKEVKDKLVKAMSEIGIKTTDDINSSNFFDFSKVSD